jgi:hypothetical protein
MNMDTSSYPGETGVVYAISNAHLDWPAGKGGWKSYSGIINNSENGSDDNQHNTGPKLVTR